MKLKAYVRKITGKTHHAIGEIQNGIPRETQSISPPKWVEILEENSDVYLLHYNEKGECTADTWHQSVEEAKSQAEFEFGIINTDWEPISK